MRPVESARLRIASKHSDKIRKALVAGINTKKLTEDFLATHKGASITPQQARDWVKVNAVADNKDLTNALRYAYADAWVIGHKSGLSQLGYAYGINKATPSMGDFIQSMSVDWSKWTPGNEAAAALLSPPNGLQTLLNASNTVIQSIDQTSYDRLGTQLASALSQGLTMDDTASLISGVLDDPSRALTIAITESARATTAASRAVYEDSGVEYVTWLVAEGCDDCQENADAGPIPIDATFPTGDAEPPAHPNCMCDLSPYVVDTQGIGGDALDNSFTPDDSGDGSDATTGSLADNIATADGNPYLDVTKVPLRLLHTVESGGTKVSRFIIDNDDESPFVFEKPLAKVISINKAGVPGPLEIARALSRLDILPNPTPNENTGKNVEKHVESPWKIAEPITVDPNIWDKAEIALVHFEDLTATDEFMNRKKIKEHIIAMGQAVTPNRSYALVLETADATLIIDGHHRLFAMWLLGYDSAPVWYVKQGE